MNGDELIRRGDVLALAEEFEIINQETGERIVYRTVEPDAVASIPAVDAVEVVRCRECEHWETDWKPHGFKPDNPRYFCDYCDLFPAGDWFCADGQRREEKHNGM